MNSTSVRNYLNSLSNSTSVIEAQKSKERYGESTLGKDAFLKLFTEQLKNQNPLEPMDNMQMIQQQAAFSQIEELQNLSSTITRGNLFQQASSLIGKSVTLQDPNNPENSITGNVDAAYLDANGSVIEVNGTMYPLELVYKIAPAVVATE